MQFLANLFSNPHDNPPPAEMKNDPLLKDLKVSGPFGPSHHRLRHAYYAKRDGKPLQYDCERIEDDLNYVKYQCPGLWRRTDDTPKELRVIVPVVDQFVRETCGSHSLD